MRHALPAMLAAVAMLVMPISAEAVRKHPHHPKRATGHASLHLSTHNLVAGRVLTVRGRLRPHGRHRLKVVVRGSSGTTAASVSERSGFYRLQLRLADPGAQTLRVYGIHDRGTTGSESV